MVASDDMLSQSETSVACSSRILDVLNCYSAQYYQSVAGNFLTVFTACMEKLGRGLTLDTVSMVLGEKRVQSSTKQLMFASLKVRARYRDHVDVNV